MKMLYICTQKPNKKRIELSDVNELNAEMMRTLVISEFAEGWQAILQGAQSYPRAAPRDSLRVEQPSLFSHKRLVISILFCNFAAVITF